MITLTFCPDRSLCHHPVHNMTKQQRPNPRGYICVALHDHLQVLHCVHVRKVDVSVLFGTQEHGVRHDHVADEMSRLVSAPQAAAALPSRSQSPHHKQYVSCLHDQFTCLHSNHSEDFIDIVTMLDKRLKLNLQPFSATPCPPSPVPRPQNHQSSHGLFSQIIVRLVMLLIQLHSSARTRRHYGNHQGSQKLHHQLERPSALRPWPSAV